MDEENKFRKFFRQNIGYFIVFLASCIYVARGLITIVETGKTISEIIVDGALAFFFGVFINVIMDLQGIINGEKDDRVVKTNKLHADTVDKITPFIDKLDEWCEKKNEEVLKNARVRILSKEGLKYVDYFDENGIPKDYELPDEYALSNFWKKDMRHKFFIARAKYKAYKKACHVKLTQLSSNVLTSDGGREYDPYYFGRTKAEYERHTNFKDIASKAGVAIISGIYGFELIKDFSWSALIWTGLQVVLFLLMAGIKMYRTMLFITDEHRGRTIKKIDKLQQFIAECGKDYTEKTKTVAIEQNEAEIKDENKLKEGESNNVLS